MPYPLAAVRGRGGLLSSSTASWPLKISDTFTDTNGTELSVHTISPTNVPSAVWKNIFSAGSKLATIQSNRMSVAANKEGHYALEAGVADVILSTVIRLSDPTYYTDIYLRLDSLTDAAGTIRNCWVVRFGAGKLELYERNATIPGTVRATVNLTTNAAQDYTIRAVCVGNTIKVTCDGANEISYTGITTHLTSTKFGLYLVGNASNAETSDNFNIYFN